MSHEWTIKSFKSGNSVAWRVPAGAEIPPDQEWRLIKDGDDFRVERIAKPKRKFNIAKVAGSATNLNYIRNEDRVFDERPSAQIHSLGHDKA